MICFISIDRKNTVNLRKIMLKNGILSYHKGFPNIENAHGIRDYCVSLPEKPTVAIVDTMCSADFGENVCLGLKEIYPDVKTIVIYDRSNYHFEKYKFSPSSDYEINGNLAGEPIYSLLELLQKLTPSTETKYRHLNLGKDRKTAIFLGYPMKLTPAEYRILLFLCSRPTETVSAETILGFCFAESYRMTETNVRSHISDINKKSKTLGGRKLILSVRVKGYKLNEYM